MLYVRNVALGVSILRTYGGLRNGRNILLYMLRSFVGYFYPELFLLFTDLEIHGNILYNAI